MKVILITSSIMLVGGFLWSALVGAIAGLRLRPFRRAYWASVPMCLILATYQVVRLVQGQQGDALNLFSRGALLAFIYCRTIRVAEMWSSMALHPRDQTGSDPDP